MRKVKDLGFFLFALSFVLTFGLPAKAKTYNEKTSETIYLNEGDEIIGGTYSGEINLNKGEIKGGTFTKTATIVSDDGKISGGTFECPIDVINASFEGGTFNNTVTIRGSGISDGTFNNIVYVNEYGIVSGGTFNNEVHVGFYGLIWGGTFNNFVDITGGSIQDGSFYGNLTVPHVSSSSPATIISGGTIEPGGQLNVPVSSLSDTCLPNISNLTYKSTVLANIEGLPESKWQDVFSEESSLNHYVTLSISPLRTMTVKNVRAGDYSRIDLTFDANGGSGTMDDSYAYVKGRIRLPKNTFTKKGATFKGWSETKTGPIKYKDKEDIDSVEKEFGTSGTKTLYAVWEDSSSGGNDNPDSTKPADTTTNNPDGSATPANVTPEKAADTVDSKLKTTSISKVTAKKKSITVTWKKQTRGINGYEIQYSTDKKFINNTKSVTVNKAKTTSKTIKKLKTGKKYFVRIRTFVNKDGKKSYSNWSKIKNIKVK